MEQSSLEEDTFHITDAYDEPSPLACELYHSTEFFYFTIFRVSQVRQVEII